MSKVMTIRQIIPMLCLFLGVLAFQLDTTLNIGERMPMQDTAMKDIDGKEKTIKSEALENGVLVVFSCNTCPFVVGTEKFEGWEKQYNSLNKLAEKNKVGMVLVNSNEAKRKGDDAFEKMIEHGKKMNYTMPYLLDVDSKFADACGAKTTPHVFLFDKDMKLAYKGSIDNLWDTKREKLATYLNDALNSLGKGNTIKISSSDPRGCSIKRVK